MDDAYAPIVRRAAETATGPPCLVRWVQAEARRLAAANGGRPVPTDELVRTLTPHVTAVVAGVLRGGPATVPEQAGETVRPE